MGALTDVDGAATILDVPEGMHDVEVRMIGYSSQKLLNVAVVAGYTSNLGIIILHQVEVPKFERMGPCGPSMIDVRGVDGWD